KSGGKVSQWILPTASRTAALERRRQTPTEVTLKGEKSAGSSDFRCVPCQPRSPFSPSMDSISQNDSDGGGGRRELESTLGDGDRGQLQSVAPSPDSMRSQTVLSLDQIRITRSSNDYTDGPSAAQQRQQKSDVVPPPGSRTGEQQATQEERSQNHRNLHSLTRHVDRKWFRLLCGGIAGQR
ncbi:sprouty-like protein 2, partial [Oryzias melastigma]